MHVVVAGASGFLGTPPDRGAARPRAHHDRAGHDVRRRPDAESPWDPDAGRLDPQVIEAADVVVNLAGSPDRRQPALEDGGHASCARAG